MSRNSFAIAVVTILLGVGCARTSSPTSPSSSAPSSIGAAAPSVPAPCAAQSPCTAPLLAQLNLAHNFLVLTYKQLNLFISLPPGGRDSWTGEVALESSDNSENSLPEYDAPGLTFPVDIQAYDALTAIVGVANNALGLLQGNNFPQSPVIDQVKANLLSIISKATILMRCQKAPCN